MDFVDIRHPGEYSSPINEIECFIFCDEFSEPGAIDAIEEQRSWIVKQIKHKKVGLILCRTKADLDLPFVDKRRVKSWALKHNAAFVSTSSKREIRICLRLCFHIHDIYYSKKERINLETLFKIAVCIIMENRSIM